MNYEAKGFKIHVETEDLEQEFRVRMTPRWFKERKECVYLTVTNLR